MGRQELVVYQEQDGQEEPGGGGTEPVAGEVHPVRNRKKVQVVPQAGVRDVEAITQLWSTSTGLIYLAFLLIWTVYLVSLTQQTVAASLTPYVTSSFASHSLTPTVGVVSSVVGGVCNLVVAKVLDIFGRPTGYVLSLLAATLGLLMMAATAYTNNGGGGGRGGGVEVYAAAQVLWTVGNNALLYTMGIFVADATTLRNRALATALTASPSLITMWLGGPISTAFLRGPGWEWAFWSFAIMVPALCLPFWGLLLYSSIKARRGQQQGGGGVVVVVAVTSPEAHTVDKNKARRRRSGATAMFVHNCREFDVVGLLLITGGLALILLPFNLYTYQPDGWRSELIICLLIFGVALMAAFATWERFLAPVTFMPFSLLLDRNMVGSCLLGASFFASYYCWFGFFNSFLQVVSGLDVTRASYVSQINGVGSTLICIATGYYIRRTGRFKNMTLYVALPVYTLFMGLMIYFRRPGDLNLAFIILCQVFIALAAGAFIIAPPIAAMCVATHQDIAAVVAVISMFSSIGGAVGNTVGGAIWQAVFPVKLAEYLPPEEQGQLLQIYGDLNVQLSYPVGSAARTAIQNAYGDAQAMMCTAGTAMLVVGLLGVAMWRDMDVRNIEQIKGQIM